MKFLSLTTGLLLALTACQPKPTQPTEDPADTITSAALEDSSTAQTLALGDTTQNALDWQGSYQGTLPCASCSGIETTLTLNLDNTYTLHQVYEGAETDQGREYEENGTLKFSPNGSYITLSAEGSNGSTPEFIYFVGEGHLYQVISISDREFDPKYKLTKK